MVTRLIAIIAVAACCAATAAPVSAQTAPSDVVRSDSDPASPVFVSIRPEFSTIGDGVEQRSLVIRYDARILGRQRIGWGVPGVILRFEAPIAAADVNGAAAKGFGDSYGQFFVLPYTVGRFVLATGSGFVLPTASSALLGSGKLTLAPIIAPIWRIPRGLFFIKFQNFTSIAGDSTRADVNYLLITPMYFNVVQRQWWFQLDTEAKVNWERENGAGFKSGVQLGWMLGSNVGVWMKPEIYWGPNRDGLWNLKTGIIWYERRARRPT